MNKIEEDLDSILEHYGVKGMRWGVRRSQEELDRAAGRTRKEKRQERKTARADKKWVRNTASTKTWVEVNNRMADQLNGPNGALAKINEKPEYKNVDVSDFSKGVGKKYLKEVEDTYNKILTDISKTIPESPSGMKAHFSTNFNEYGMMPSLTIVASEEVKHADSFEVSVTWSKKGHLVSVGEIKQSTTIENDLNDILEHYGVKGMRWGVRRSREELDRAAGRRAAAGKPVTPTRRQRKLAKKAAKSERASQKQLEEQLSEDARKTEAAIRKIEQGGTLSLSNEELRLVTQRLNLEQQYQKLSQKQAQNTMSDGQKYVDDFLGVVNNKAQQKIADELVNAAARQVAAFFTKKSDD